MDEQGNTKDDLRLPNDDELAKLARGPASASEPYLREQESMR